MANLCQPAGSFHSATLITVQGSLANQGMHFQPRVSQDVGEENKEGVCCALSALEERCSQNNLDSLETLTYTSEFRDPKQNSTGLWLSFC